MQENALRCMAALRKCRAISSRIDQLRYMSTTLGALGEHFEGPPRVDYAKKKNPSGVTPETVAHVELARRISKLMWCQDHLVVPVIEEWMAEGNSITRYGLIVVRHKLRRRKRFHHALRVSDWIAYKQRVIPYDHQEALNHIDLASRVDVEGAKHMFDNLPRDWKSREAYTVLLSMYVRNNMSADAEAIYYTLRRWGLRSISPVNMILTLYQKNKVFSKVSELIEDAKKANIELDKCSYNILLPMIFKKGGVSEMERLYERMKSGNFVDEHTYCMLGRFYGRAGMKDKAVQMLKEVEKGIGGGRFNRLRRTYNVLIVIYGILNDVEGVKRIWNVMNKMELTCEDYICMIKSFAKVGLYEEAESGFLTLAAQKKMHISVCNAMLEVCEAGGFILKAESIWRSIHQMGFKPDATTYHILISMLIKNGHLQKALDLFQLERRVFRVPFELTRQEEKFKSNLPSKAMKPFIGTCAMLLRELARSGQVVACEELLRNWRLERWKTDVRLFNALLKAYVVVNEHAAGFLKRMEADGVEPDKETMYLLDKLPQRPLFKQLH